MAIGWAIAPYAQRSRGANVIRIIAYNTRSEIRDERTGDLWSGRHKLRSLLHAEAMLPDGADERFLDIGTLANAIQANEKRKDAVLGRDALIPLPRGKSFEEKLELARSFFKEYFVDKGIPVILTLHNAHGLAPNERENDHANGFITERYLNGSEFSVRKAARFEPPNRNWSKLWREYQERRGIIVDPPALIPGKHLGPNLARDPTSDSFKRQAARVQVAQQLERVDDLARDLLTAIAAALSATEPADQTARLIGEMTKIVADHAGKAPTPLAQLLLRAITDALAAPTPEPILIRKTGDALRLIATINERKGGEVHMELTDAGGERYYRQYQITQTQQIPEWKTFSPTQLPPADKQQERAEQRQTERALFRRYQSERQAALEARKAAEQDVHSRFASYQKELRGFYNLRHEQEKLPARRGIERRDAHELLKAERHGDRLQTQQLRAQALATVRREHMVPTWEDWLTREAERGDRAAANTLQRRQERARENEHER